MKYKSNKLKKADANKFKEMKINIERCKRSLVFFAQKDGIDTTGFEV